METVPLQSQVIRHLIWIRLLNNLPKWAWLTLQTLSQDQTHYKSWSSVPASSHSSLLLAMQMATMNLHSTKRSQSQLTTTTWVLSLTTELSCHSLRASWMLSRWSSPLGCSPPSSSHLETARSSLSPLTTPCLLSEMQYMLAWLVCVLARWMNEGSNMHKLKLCSPPSNPFICAIPFIRAVKQRDTREISLNETALIPCSVYSDKQQRSQSDKHTLWINVGFSLACYGLFTFLRSHMWCINLGLIKSFTFQRKTYWLIDWLISMLRIW
jgi:hypothetical protein